jgi:hypothetical protein
VAGIISNINFSGIISNRKFVNILRFLCKNFIFSKSNLFVGLKIICYNKIASKNSFNVSNLHSVGLTFIDNY